MCGGFCTCPTHMSRDTARALTATGITLLSGYFFLTARLPRWIDQPIQSVSLAAIIHTEASVSSATQLGHCYARHFSVAAPRLWNSLPLNCQTLQLLHPLTHSRSVLRHFSLIRHNHTVARASVLWRDINLLIDWLKWNQVSIHIWFSSPCLSLLMTLQQNILMQ